MRATPVGVGALALLATLAAGCGAGGTGSSTHYTVDAVTRCLESHNLTVRHIDDMGLMPSGFEGNLEVDDNGEEQVDLVFSSDRTNAKRTTEAAKSVPFSDGDLVRQKGNVTYWAMTDTSQLQIAEQCLGSSWAATTSRAMKPVRRKAPH
jgi:hypothetical protein